MRKLLFILIIVMFIFGGNVYATDSYVDGSSSVGGSQNSYIDNTGGINGGSATGSYSAQSSGMFWSDAEGQTNSNLNLCGTQDGIGDNRSAIRGSHVNSLANTNTSTFLCGRHYHQLSVSGEAGQYNQAIVDHENGNFAGGYNESGVNYDGYTEDCSSRYFGTYSETSIYGEAETIGFTNVNVNEGINHSESNGITANYSYANHNGNVGNTYVTGNGFIESGTYVSEGPVISSSYSSGSFNYTGNGIHCSSGGGYSKSSTTSDINTGRNFVSSSSSATSYSASFSSGNFGSDPEVGR